MAGHSNVVGRKVTKDGEKWARSDKCRAVVGPTSLQSPVAGRAGEIVCGGH